MNREFDTCPRCGALASVDTNGKMLCGNCLFGFDDDPEENEPDDEYNDEYDLTPGQRTITT